MPTAADGYGYEPVPRVNGAAPPELVAASRALFRGTLGMMGPPGVVRMTAEVVASRLPVAAGRAEEAAAVVGVAPLDLLAAHLCYDLLLGQSGMGCSTLALAGENGPVLARNMDWFPEVEVARASCLLAEPFGVNAGFVGMVGAVTGMSRRGFAVALNAAFGGGDVMGHPMLLFLRHVLDTADGFTEAVAMCERERLAAGGILTLVGTRNDERAVVERTPTRAAVRRATGGEPLVATNHHRRLSAPQGCSRYEYLARHGGVRSPLELLTSPEVRQTITAQHVRMCPAAGEAEMWVPTHLLADGAAGVSAAEAVGCFT